MKKITLILAFIGMISLTSCTVEETRVSNNGYDSDTISEIWEFNKDFYAGNGFSVFLDFPHQTYASDMVLVYHLYDVVNGSDVWRLMPQTYYFNGGGELNYNFDFTTYDANIFLEANFDLNALDPSWTQNQIFRVVVIPGYFGNKMATPVDFNDYKAVTNYYDIKEKDIVKISQ